MRAVASNLLEAAELLLNKGADPDLTTSVNTRICILNIQIAGGSHAAARSRRQRKIQVRQASAREGSKS